MRPFLLGFVALAATASTINALDCSTFDPSRIKIITFDVFAALMDTPDSLLASVQAWFPTLPANTTQQIVIDWITVYGDYFGDTFNQNTQTPEPFTWVVRMGLAEILTRYGLTGEVPINSTKFYELSTIWGNLQPWPKTQETLQVLQQKYLVAALSNGDKQTLQNATSILKGVNFAAHFSSDYPIGAFKPNALIYAQVAKIYGIENVLHVAGSAIDAYGARSYGLYAALLGEQPQPGPAPCFLLPNITYVPGIMGM